jgi:Fe-S-cluster-containing dehydrogenase component
MATGFAFDFEKCTECRRCMIACSEVKTGAVRMAGSRIEIIRSWPELPDIRVCRFDDCAGHPCVASCPVDAITEAGGLVLIDRETCTGCEACVEACPFHAIRMESGTAMKCDFCAGDPECVKACVTVAIAKKGG